jgi:hypothetical protein
MALTPHQTLYRTTDNYIELVGLVDPLTNQAITTAFVQVTLKDKDGANVAGRAWPMTMNHVFTAPGTYRGVLPLELVVTLGGVYTAEIMVEVGPTQRRLFRTPIVVRDSV